MLDRGLRRSYARAATAEAEAQPTTRSPPTRAWTSRALPTFTIDPDDAKDFDDAISARREDGHVRVWVHIADVSAYVRPGGPLETRGLPARHQRVRAGRRRADAARGALQPRVLAAAGGGQAGGDGRDGDARRPTCAACRSTARGCAATGASPTARSTRSSPAAARAEEPWAGRWRRRARWPRALAAQARRGRDRHARADLRLRRRRSRDRRALRGADRVAPPDRAADDPRQRAGGRLPGRRTACRPSTACTSAPSRTSVAFLLEQLASLDIPTPPVPEHMTPQQAADVAAEASRIVARESRGRRRVRRAGAALAQAGVLLAEEPRPRRPRRARATATSPRRSGATRTWWRTARCSRARHRPDAAPGARAGRGGGRLSSAAERDAMKIERARRRRLPGLPARARLAERRSRAPPAFEGEVVGLIEKGAFVRFGERGLRGPAAGAAPARLVDAQRAGHRARGARARAAACASATRSRSSSTASRRRAGASICRPPMHTRRRAWPRSASARQHPATWRPTARPRFATTCSRGRGRHRAAGLGGEVAAQRRGAAQGRLRRGARRRGVAAQHAHRPYEPAREDHDPERPRKLLLHQPRDRAPDRQDRREGAHARARRASTSRARAPRSSWRVAKGKEHARQAPRDQGPRRRSARSSARCRSASSRARSTEAAVGGPARQLVAARQLELAQHRRHVRLDRLRRDVEPQCDLLVHVAARDVLEHLALARR